MNHDPLCPLPDCDYGLPKGECMGYEDCSHHCACHVIAKARAEEREKAAQRLEADLPHYEDCSLGAGARDCDCERRDAIDAVRGES